MKNRSIYTVLVLLAALFGFFTACEALNEPNFGSTPSSTPSSTSSYTVSFEANGGTAVETQTVTNGGKANQPEGVAKNGYTFAGWFADNTATAKEWDFAVNTVTKAVTLYAKWHPVTYIVRYNKNATNATETMVDSTHTYDVEQSLTANGYTYTGYGFAGWNTEADGSGTDYSNGATVKNLTATAGAVFTLYAKWGGDIYTVSYDKNAADAIGTMAASSHIYDVEKALTANGYTRTGYIFTGWNTQANGEGINYAESQNVENLTMTAGGVITLYALWNPVTYTVRYDKNAADAIGTTADSSHTYNVEKALTANGYTRTGYTFGGWNTQSNGGGTSYANIQDVKNLTATADTVFTLYAKWTAIIYTVRYDKNADDASGTMADSSHTYDVEKALTANSYTYTGYGFAGWNTVADGSGTAYSGGATVKNLSTTARDVIILYAQWKIVTYTVRYNGNGSTGGTTADSTHTYNVEKTLTANGYTPRMGYIFAGWNTQADGRGTTYADGATVENLTATIDAVFTLYAKWNPITYTVRYDKNATDAIGTIPGSIHTYDFEKALFANGYTRTNYTFGGWNTAANGGGTNYSSGATVKNLSATEGAVITLYAVWLTWAGADFGSGDVISNTFNVANTTQWNTAVSTISGGGNDKNYIINVTADFTIAGRTTYNFGNTTGIKVSIRGVGRTLTLSSNGNIMRIAANQTVILRDVTLRGLDNNNNSLVYVAGIFTMQSGKISGNSSSSGGGVYMDTNSTFTMQGGEISGNTDPSNSSGGGVYMIGGTFTMSGGVISSNTVPSNRGNSGGGGVYMIDGTFTMSGGVISGNTGPSSWVGCQTSGGVHIHDGNFTMSGGIISGNSGTWGGGVVVGTATTTNATFIMHGGKISSNSSSAGGGVFGSGTFTMNDGEISGNTGNNGGGVYMNGGTFTMSGGVISGNTATGNVETGGGVYISSGTFTMNGGVISGNTATTAIVNGGGGVRNSGTFRIVTGTIYGSNEVDTSLRNRAPSLAALCGTAEYGIFIGDTWSINGDLRSTNDTIRIVNGVLQE